MVPASKQTCSHDGFTLIELLTVVAIIGVLAAVLFVAIGRARAAAGGARCVSNLRQIGMAVAMYSNDHNHRLPGPLHPLQTPWFDGDTERLQNGSQIGGYLSLPAASWSNTQYSSIFSDPTWEAQATQPVIPSQPNLNQYWLALNVRPAPPGAPVTDQIIDPWGQDDGNPSDTVVPPKSQSLIDQPARIWAMLETDGEYIPFGWGESLGAANAGCPPTPPHGNYRYTLFFDGHVGRLDLNNNPI